MYSTYFKPYPQLETERLILRKVKKSDLDDLYDYCRSPISAKYAEWTPHEDIGVTRQYISWLLSAARHGQYMTWCIELKESQKVIGTCSFTDMDTNYKVAEIGYGIGHAYWGHGYAAEAVSAVMEYGFCNIGLIRIFARIMKENLASVRLANRVGMQCDGFLPNGIYCKSAKHDLYLFGITDDQYKKLLNTPKNEEDAEASENSADREAEKAKTEPTKTAGNSNNTNNPKDTKPDREKTEEANNNG